MAACAWICQNVNEVAHHQCLQKQGEADKQVNQQACNQISWTKKLVSLLDLCVSSLRRGHANLLCIVPILVYVQPKQVHKVNDLQPRLKVTFQTNENK